MPSKVGGPKMYEYKFIPTPRQTTRDGRLRNERGALAGSLDSEATMLSAAGWEFMRFDRLPITVRRFVFLKATGEEQVMIFRRQVRELVPSDSPADTLSEPSPGIRPRRVPRGQRRYIPERLMVPGPAA